MVDWYLAPSSRTALRAAPAAVGCSPHPGCLKRPRGVPITGRMKSVNLLPADLRTGSQRPAPAGPTGAETPAPPPSSSWAPSPSRSSPWPPRSWPATPSRTAGGAGRGDRQAGGRPAGRRAQALRRLPRSRQGPRPERRQLATSRFDWEHALRDVSRAMPEAVSLGSIGRPRSARAPRGELPAARRDQGAGDQAQGLHPRPEQGGHADGPPARRPGRHPREPVAVPEGGRPAAAAGGDRTRPAPSGFCGPAGLPAFELVDRSSRRRRPQHSADARRHGGYRDARPPTPAAGAAAPAATPAAGATPAPAGAAPAATPPRPRPLPPPTHPVGATP